jgi:UDP-N-acetylglucosamine 2-epimerase (non-hydrolysing)
MNHNYNKKVKILFIIGTRPELIKLAVLIKLLKQQAWTEVTVLITAQHRELLDQMLSLHGIKADIDLNIMQENQDLSTLTGNLFIKTNALIREINPDIIFAQGDTTTVMVASMVAFYTRIKFAHIEAGLRSHDLCNPFPEELNRVITGLTADFHFVPTAQDKLNLLDNKVSKKKIFIVGNTVIDNLLETSKKDIDICLNIPKNKKIILVTLHRRENFGEPLKNICSAICDIVKEFQDICVIYPVHPNPNVSSVVKDIMQDQDRIILCDPLDYQQFIALMQKSYFILTDSGGVQEEAPVFGKPVLVTRDKTERMESIKAGLSKLIGVDYSNVKKEIKNLLENNGNYQSMSKKSFLYGDGKASQRIMKTIKEHFIYNNVNIC